MAIQDANEIDVQIKASGDGQLGRVQLVRWSDAEEALVRTLRNVALTIKFECVQIDSWTSFKFWRAAADILTKYLEIGKQKIEEKLLPQNKAPKGTQAISARGTFKLLKLFDRSRQLAIHLPRGKLPLSEAEWKKRYEARYLKAHPNKSPGRRRKGGEPAGAYKEMKVKLTDSERYGTKVVWMTKAQLKNRNREKHDATGGQPGGDSDPTEYASHKHHNRGRPVMKRHLYKVKYLKTRAKFKTVLVRKSGNDSKRKWKGAPKPRDTAHGRPIDSEWNLIRRMLDQSP